MKKIRFLYSDDYPETLLPYVVEVVDKLISGDKSINSDNEIITCNQSTSIFFKERVIGRVREGIEVYEGEVVDIVFDCLSEKECNYPFCGSKCPGNNTQFRILGKESRKY